MCRAKPLSRGVTCHAAPGDRGGEPSHELPFLLLDGCPGPCGYTVVSLLCRVSSRDAIVAHLPTRPWLDVWVACGFVLQ